MLRPSRIPEGMDIPSPDNLSLASFTDQDFYQDIAREFTDVYAEIKAHLTKDEHLCLSVYKNSKKIKKNGPYRAFFETHRGEQPSSSLITHRKKRLEKILPRLGALLRFKRDNNLDGLLKDHLLLKQYNVLMLYERRLPLSDIQQQLEHKHPSTTSGAFGRAVKALLRNNDHPLIQRYIELLSQVLHYSRIRKII